MITGVLRTRCRDKDGDRNNVPMKCNLDREDYTSLRFPLILPYAWISRRDSCLVGVSCHIPSSGLTYACFHLCIMSIFLKLELRNFESLKNWIKSRAKNPRNLILCSKMSFCNVENFGKSYISNQNLGTFLRNYFGTLNLNQYYLEFEFISKYYWIYVQITETFLCALV